MTDMYEAGFYLSKSVSNAIKIMAAVLVMLSHYSQYICANNLSDSLIFSIISSLGGYLGVALFFFLSGYGLMESEKNSHLNAIKFLKKRLLKVYLPVISVTLLWLAISSLVMTNSPFREINATWG